MSTTTTDENMFPIPRRAIILGATADIGHDISRRLLADGWSVVGLGRSRERIADLVETPHFHFVQCDLADNTSVKEAVAKASEIGQDWSLFVSSAGTMEPIGPFFQQDFDEWESSVIVNSTAQLRVLHGLWPCRRKGVSVDVMLMAGGGTNSAFTNYSAYCVSKIALIKMCELIDDEAPDANVFIIGPGFVQTRIHDETIRAGEKAGDGLGKTLAFLETPGTSLADIYDHMLWCMAAGKEVASGRNFSTVHDAWRNGGSALKQALVGDAHALRLRRHMGGTK
jgi:NADP-dependent 3-hydroxy acid dehydrogenase YdfG